MGAVVDSGTTDGPHAGGALLAVIAGLARYARGDRHSFARRSNPFWPGVGHGLLVAPAMALVTGAMVADSVASFVPATMWVLLWSGVLFELPVICLTGGLAWAYLTRGRTRPIHGAAIDRPRW